ncbi:MAG TPA: energy transducer TonB [Stenotrophobium sp.]|nr:energy transducer TonB [Stenotrophobium sp.]
MSSFMQVMASDRWLPERRWLVSLTLALIVVLCLFWFLQHVIRPAQTGGVAPAPIEGVQVVQAKPDEQPQAEEQLFKAAAAPPPAAPPALPQMNMPAVNMPAPAMAAVDAGPINLPVKLGTGSMSLGSSGSFGGFAGGGGSGNGAGSGGYGGGQGFVGKPLIPLSTARPQMPEWACKKKIKGWVEAVFTVMPNGRVRNVKIIDAEPRGVYEAAAVESISNWIYAESDRAREVKQRVTMDPADCAYNWSQ